MIPETQEDVGVDEMCNPTAIAHSSHIAQTLEERSTPDVHSSNVAQASTSATPNLVLRPSLERFSSKEKFMSPFKKYLSVPKTPEQNPGKIIKKRLKFPSVVSSEEYKLYLIKKEEEQEKKKSKKRTKPSENEAQAPGKPGKGKTLQKKKKVMDWTCKKCKASWNQEVKSGIPTKWIECETCMKWFHDKCISKKQ